MGISFSMMGSNSNQGMGLPVVVPGAGYTKVCLDLQEGAWQLRTVQPSAVAN
jgi:hypothetical protein